MDTLNELVSITQEIQALETAISLLEEYTNLDDLDSEEDVVDILQKRVMELETEREEILREAE